MTKNKMEELKKYIKAFDHLKDIVIITDPEGIIINVNKTFEDRFNYKSSALSGLHYSMLASISNDFEIYDKMCSDASLKGLSSCEMIFCDSNSREIYLELSCSAVYEHSKEVAGFIIIGHEISERKKIELATIEINNYIKAESSILESTIISMPEGIIVTDNSLNIIKVNRLAESILEIKSHELLGRSLLLAIPYEPLNKLIIEALKNPQKIINSDFEIFNKSGREIFLRAKICHIINNENNSIGIILILTNITGEKELDNLKSNFMSLISHELRTPLTSIIGYTNIIMDDETKLSTADQKNFMSKISKNSLHLLELINDLLDILQLELKNIHINMTEFDIKALIKEVLASYYKLASAKNIAVNFYYDDRSDGKITADELKIRQVIVNLLNNAIKFTPNNGKIEIKVRYFETRLEFSISDTGIGISPDKIKNIFHNFYQVDTSSTRKYGGTGLGLPICKKIIELHNGSIWVDSVIDQGSSFHFAIPIIKQTNKAAEKNNGKKIKIAYMPILDHAPLMIAQQNHFRCENDEKIEWIQCSDWDELNDKIIKRKVDCASIMLPMFFNLLANNMPVKLLSVLNRNGVNIFSKNDEAFAAITKKETETTKNTGGIKVAVPHKDSTHYTILKKIIELNKLNIKNIKVEIIKNNETLINELNGNHVDVVMESEPFAYDVKRGCDNIKYINSGDIFPFHPNSVIISFEDTISTKPELLNYLLNLIHNAAKFIINEKSSAANMLEPFLDLTAKEIEIMISKTNLISFINNIACTDEIINFKNYSGNTAIKLFINDNFIINAVNTELISKIIKNSKYIPEQFKIQDHCSLIKFIE